MEKAPDPFKNYVMKGTPIVPAKQETSQTDPADLVAVNAMTWRKLVATLDAMPPGTAVLPLAREIMDRIEGRPVQRTDSRVLTQSKGEIIIKLID